MIGTIVNGNWRIVRLIGAGGMGAVYECVHQQLGLRRALKTLLVGSNAQLLQRFHQEAMATAALKHKNIIAIHDYGELPDHTQWIMMDLLDGCTLAELLRQHNGPLPLERALRILTQIALALAAAHEHGIVHRDLKPENVFVTKRDGEEDHVVLLDFGIAKHLGSKAGMTRTHAVIGTPCFMPPEQLRGLKDIDHRADIFALGAIAYLLVTGFMPFQQANESYGDYIDLSLFELHERQTRGGPVEPRIHVPTLPEDWSIGIRSAVDRDRSRRPRLDELIVLLKRSTPNGQAIVERCAKDLLKQAGLEETLRVVAPAPASELETIRSKPALQSAASETVRSKPLAGASGMPRISPAAVTPVVPPVAAAPAPVPPGPRSGPETVTMSPPRAEPVPMVAIPTPPSPTTISGAASEAMPAARPPRRWILPVIGTALFIGATAIGVVLAKGRHSERTTEPTESAVATSTDPRPAAAAAARDAGLQADAAAMTATMPQDAAPALTANKDAPPPDDGSPVTPTHDSATNVATSSARKPTVKAPHEMGWLDVFIEKTYAEVYVDGVHRGSSPFHQQLTVGKHTITLRNPDVGRREVVVVTIDASKPTTIDKPW